MTLHPALGSFAATEGISSDFYMYILIALFAGVATCVLTLKSIPRIGVALREHGIYGIDINKLTVEERSAFSQLRAAVSTHKLIHDSPFRRCILPESAGIAVGMSYIAVVLVSMVATLDLDTLHELSASLCSIVLMLLLGFVDDVLDVRWRYKVLFSLVSTIPILITYRGSTSIVLPIPMRRWMGCPPLIDLGIVYYVAMSLICVFCSNSINILAGINGVEAGQTLVIASGIAIHCLVQVLLLGTTPVDAGQSPNHVVAQSYDYARSLMLTFPLIGAVWALLRYNRYPSKIFVGDSFTYFAGMTLAVISITGRFTKTLLLFFLPQLLNFTLSLPQLLGWMHCPRHRVPRWDPERDVLCNSGNLTLLNAFLWLFGDMHERSLTKYLIWFQILCSVLAFGIRYSAVGVIFEHVR